MDEKTKRIFPKIQNKNALFCVIVQKKVKCVLMLEIKICFDYGDYKQMPAYDC